MQNYGETKKLSVIIPTLNRASLLRQTLHSIAGQTFPKEDFEIIVIDNGSCDNTKEVCAAYQRQNGNLRYIYDDRPGLHTGRNRGFAESRSDILVYADDDIIAFPSWLWAIYEGFRDEKTVLIGGNNYPRFERKPPRWVDCLWSYSEKEKAKRLETYSVIVIGKESRRIKPGMVFGCNFAVRKEIIERAGGFHPDGMPDACLKFRGDGESFITGYIAKYNMKAMFYPDASVYHVVSRKRMTKNYVAKVSYRTGISAGFARIRAMRSGIDIFGILRQSLTDLFKNRISRDKKEILAIKKTCFLKGYFYIVVQYCINRKVRNWISRDSYMDAEIPE